MLALPSEYSIIAVWQVSAKLYGKIRCENFYPNLSILHSLLRSLTSSSIALLTTESIHFETISSYRSYLLNLPNTQLFCLVVLNHKRHTRKLLVVQASFRHSFKLSLFPARHIQLLPQASYTGQSPQLSVQAL